MDTTTSRDRTTIAFDRSAMGRRSSWSAASRPPGPRTRHGGAPRAGLHGAQLRPPGPRRFRGHPPLRGRTRGRGHRRPESLRPAGWRPCSACPPERPSPFEAAAGGLAIDKLALWEPPFDAPEGRRPPPDLAQRYEAMIAEGRRGDVVEYFMANVVGLPPEFVAHAKTQPSWRRQEAMAHTFVYETSWATARCRWSGRRPWWLQRSRSPARRASRSCARRRKNSPKLYPTPGRASWRARLTPWPRRPSPPRSGSSSGAEPSRERRFAPVAAGSRSSNVPAPTSP